MTINMKHKEVWSTLLRLSKKGHIKPLLYFPYKSGPLGVNSTIAEDDTLDPRITAKKVGRQKSEVVKMVDQVLGLAVKTIGTTVSNKSVAMCQIRKSNKEVVCVYFCTYDSKRIICTAIQSDADGMVVCC